jgi:hypothetical protein
MCTRVHLLGTDVHTVPGSSVHFDTLTGPPRRWPQPTAANPSDAAADFNHDGFAELAAAAPMEDVGTVSNAGALSLLPGSGAGLTSTGGRLFTQASPGIPGTPETFDLFGGLEVVF